MPTDEQTALETDQQVRVFKYGLPRISKESIPLAETYLRRAHALYNAFIAMYRERAQTVASWYPQEIKDLQAQINNLWENVRNVNDQISYLLGTVVGVREATSAVQEAAGVGGGYGYTGPASVRFFADLYKLGQQVHQGDLDAGFWKALNNAGGTLFHYPAAQINRTAQGLAALMQGDTRNPLVLLAGPPPP